MLQMTVIGKKSELPNSANRTITPLTNRYGAIFRRNCATGGASQRRSSSLVTPVIASGCGAPAKDIGAYDGCGCPYDAPPFMACPAIDAEDGADLGSAGRACDDAEGAAARGAGAERVSSAATRAVALGKRFCGSFSSSVMIERARSVGTSARRCSTGTGRSEMCF